MAWTKSGTADAFRPGALSSTGPLCPHVYVPSGTHTEKHTNRDKDKLTVICFDVPPHPTAIPQPPKCPVIQFDFRF